MKGKRGRKIIHFYPSFSNNVKPKLGKEFLKFVNMHFQKNNKINKIFNKTTIKLSYSFIPNIESIMNCYNRRVLKTNNEYFKLCNCKKKVVWSFNRKYLLNDV